MAAPSTTTSRPCCSLRWAASSPKAAEKPWSRRVIGSSENCSWRSERTTPRFRSRASFRIRRASGSSAASSASQAACTIRAMPEIVCCGPVVQRQREAAALVLLGVQQAVREPGALALPLLGLGAQALGQGEQAGVLGGAGREVGEHPQLGQLERREAARRPRRPRAARARGSARRAASRGRSRRRCGRAGRRRSRGRTRRQRLGQRQALARGRGDLEDAVGAELQHHADLGVHQPAGLVGGAAQDVALVEVVGDAGQRGDQAVERRGLLEQVAGELALELDGPLGARLRPQRPQREPEQQEQRRRDDGRADHRAHARRSCGGRKTDARPGRHEAGRVARGGVSRGRQGPGLADDRLAQGDRDRLRAGVGLELGQDVANVALDGLLAR